MIACLIVFRAEYSLLKKMILTRFFLTRHAEPDWSVSFDKELRGAEIDFCPLSQKGIEQAENLALDLSKVEAEIIITSPYTRALQTGAIISRVLEIPLIVEYDLREWIADFRKEYTLDELFDIIKEFKEDSKGFQTEKKINWEPQSELAQRIRNVLTGYLNYSNVIVVSHGIAINSQIPDAFLGYGEITKLVLK